LGDVACTGKYKHGLKPAAAELADVLRQHAKWLKDGGPHNPQLSHDPRKADLCDANLIGVNLTNANLDHADLAGAKLMNASLDRAILTLANLTYAILKDAHLDSADLDDANLVNADLAGAHLMNASLHRTDLTLANLTYATLEDAHLDNAHLNNANLGGADLGGAHLTGAILKGGILTYANLGGADLGGADLAGAYLDFDPASPPKVVPGIYTARNLYLVKFRDQPAGLVKLRGEFKVLGMRTQEAQLTYAIRRSELSRQLEAGQYVHSWSERYFNSVCFDWTCEYGMSPSRPLFHPTTKPVELIARMVGNSSRPGELVYDPFCGSGSTLVAAHQLGRIGYGVEIDPGYVAVTLERLSALELKPKLIGEGFGDGAVKA